LCGFSSRAKLLSERRGEIQFERASSFGASDGHLRVGASLYNFHATRNAATFSVNGSFSSRAGVPFLVPWDSRESKNDLIV
jgi:hypothetical protein